MRKHTGFVHVKVADDGRVKIIAKMSGEIFKRGAMWISYCPALDLSTCGKTKEEALENTKEAVQLFFESCIRRRTLNKALQELKWRRQNDINLDGVADPVACTTKASSLPPAFVIDKVKNKTWQGAVTM